jgi:hypothetical protein
VQNYVPSSASPASISAGNDDDTGTDDAGVGACSWGPANFDGERGGDFSRREDDFSRVREGDLSCTRVRGGDLSCFFASARIRLIVSAAFSCCDFSLAKFFALTPRPMVFISSARATLAFAALMSLPSLRWHTTVNYYRVKSHEGDHALMSPY